MADDLQSLRRDIDALKTQNRQIEPRTGSLEKFKSQSENLTDTLRSQSSSLDIRTGTLEKTTTEQGRQIGSLERTYDQIQQTFIKFENQLTISQQKEDESHLEISQELAHIDRQITMLSRRGEEQLDQLNDDRDQIDEVSNNIDTINGNVTTIQNSIGTINGNVTTIQNQINTINGNVGTIQTNISAINGNVSSINTTIGTINGDIDEINISVGTINGRIETVEANFTNIDTVILNFAGVNILYLEGLTLPIVQYINNFNATFTSQNSTLQQHDSAIVALQQIVQSGPNTNTILDNRIDALEITVNINSSTRNAQFRTDITNLQTLADSHGTSIINLQNIVINGENSNSLLRSDLTSLSGTVSGHTSSISSINGSINTINNTLNSHALRLTNCGC